MYRTSKLCKCKLDFNKSELLRNMLRKGKSKLNLSSENIFKLVCLCESCEGECIVVPNRNLRKVFDQILTAAYLHVVTFKKNEKDRASELH